MFQEFIGMLQWPIELGQVDIASEISILSQYQALPRQGHMEQMMHICYYLSWKPKTSIYVDLAFPDLQFKDFNQDMSQFKEYDRNAEELMLY